MKVLECKPDVGGFKDCGVVFSGLDQDVAGDIGESGQAVRPSWTFSSFGFLDANLRVRNITEANGQNSHSERPSSSSFPMPKTTVAIPLSHSLSLSSTLPTST
jgi:hypothetical protein